MDHVPESLISLIGSYGPGMAPWVLLFIFFAMFCGWIGKMALGNVRTLLQEGENLNNRMRKQLTDCTAEIEARDVKIKELQADIDVTINHFRTSRREMAGLEDTIHNLKRTCDQLTSDLSDALTALEVERNKYRRTDYDQPQR
ncbi:MAG: hypothetical protein ABIM73_06550 [Arenimonas sp.]